MATDVSPSVEEPIPGTELQLEKVRRIAKIGVLALGVVGLVAVVYWYQAESSGKKEDAAADFYASTVKTIQAETGNPDYKKYISSMESNAAVYAGTDAEPWILYLLGNQHFKDKNLDRAEAVFRDLQRRFPNHYLVSRASIPPAEGTPLTEMALQDVERERKWLKEHPPKVITRPIPAPGLSVTLETSAGAIVLGLFKDQAPRHVENFVKQAKEGAYDGTLFHQVLAGQRIVGGDPNSKDGNPANDGQGGADRTVQFEKVDAHFTRATLGMVSLQDEVSSNGSQFFICVQDQLHLDGKSVAFGEVTEGMDIVDRVSSVKTLGANESGLPPDRPEADVVILKATVKEPGPPAQGGG